MITRREAEDIARQRKELDIYHGPLSVCTDTYESTDAAADLVRAKLAHYPDRPVLWGVDGDGKTVCITGNGPQAEAHATWIAMLLHYWPGMLERIAYLEKLVADYDAKLSRIRQVLNGDGPE
jgi:hypothetical protein